MLPPFNMVPIIAPCQQMNTRGNSSKMAKLTGIPGNCVKDHSTSDWLDNIKTDLI
jgi:hypothetical protein